MATRLEVTALSSISAALSGNIEAAELALYLHAYSIKYGDFVAETISVQETETQKDIRIARENAKASRAAKRLQNAQTKDHKLAKSKSKRGSRAPKIGGPKIVRRLQSCVSDNSRSPICTVNRSARSELSK